MPRSRCLDDVSGDLQTSKTVRVCCLSCCLWNLLDQEQNANPAAIWALPYILRPKFSGHGSE